MDNPPTAIMVFDGKNTDLVWLNPKTRWIVYGNHMPDRSLSGLLDAAATGF